MNLSGGKNEKQHKRNKETKKTVGAPAGPARRALSKVEAKRMIDAWQTRTRNRDHALLQLMYFSGLRVSEALSLKVRQVWDGANVRPRVTVNAKSTKGKRKAANIDTCPAVRNALAVICHGHDGNEWLFRSEKQDKKPLSRYRAWKIIKTMAIKADLADVDLISCHSGRKSFAQNMYKGYKGDITKTAAAMRHANINNTQKYLALDAPEISRVILAQEPLVES